MGSDERHYRLHGRNEQLSDGYGRIFIHQVTVQQVTRFSPSTKPPERRTEEVDPFALGAGLMYEYLKVARSPVLYHPDEDLTLMQPLGYARWNESFDLVLMSAPMITQALDYVRSIQQTDGTPQSLSPEIGEGLDEDDDLPPIPAKSVIEHYGNLVFVLDKTKFAREAEPSSISQKPA
jgi:hypothetical protein